MEPVQRSMPPIIIRSRLVLELASELVANEEFPFRRVHLSMKKQDYDSEEFCLFGSGSSDAIERVAQGEFQVAMINPSVVLTMAYRGTGPFSEPLPLRVITVIPDFDQVGFGVSESTGLGSLAEIRERQFPLRVSTRGPRESAVVMVVNQVLGAAGFSLDDIDAWGGEVRYDRNTPAAPERIGAFESGEIDAIFDEAVVQFASRGTELGMRFLPVEEPLLQKLESVGLRRGTIEKSLYPPLSADVETVDFSGFPVFTHADVPGDQIRAVCAALEARKDRIPWETWGKEMGPLPLERMCRDTVHGPMDVPLHPAAEEYWRELGYL